MVIIKKAFQLSDLEEDDSAILEIKEDMRNAGEKFGEVTNVVLYDKEPEGIVSVRFKEFEEAEAFVKAFNGKGYNNDKLQLSVADDRPRYRKTNKEEVYQSESEEEWLKDAPRPNNGQATEEPAKDPAQDAAPDAAHDAAPEAAQEA